MGDRYELVAGERRLRAARLAQLTQIPAIVRILSDEQTLELSLIENIQREDLSALEQARAFERLSGDFALT
jgi:ParB family chromosome partitioning protein